MEAEPPSVGIRIDAAPVRAQVRLSTGAEFDLDGVAASIAALVGVYRDVINDLGVGTVEAEFNESKVWMRLGRSFPPLRLR